MKYSEKIPVEYSLKKKIWLLEELGAFDTSERGESRERGTVCFI